MQAIGSTPHDGKTPCPPESRCVECWPDDSKNPALVPENRSYEVSGSSPHDGKSLCPPASRCIICWPELAYTSGDVLAFLDERAEWLNREIRNGGDLDYLRIKYDECRYIAGCIRDTQERLRKAGLEAEAAK